MEFVCLRTIRKLQLPVLMRRGFGRTCAELLCRRAEYSARFQKRQQTRSFCVTVEISPLRSGPRPAGKTFLVSMLVAGGEGGTVFRR